MACKEVSPNPTIMCKEHEHRIATLAEKVVDLFTFSRGGNGNQRRGCVTLMWLVALSIAISVPAALMWPHGTLRIFSWTQTNKKTNQKWKEFIKHIESGDVLVECK